MKLLIALLPVLTLLSLTASAGTAIGVGYQGAQTNCNIQTGGNGTVSNCSSNPNGTVVCSCDSFAGQVQAQGGSCNTSIGVGYQGAQSNCTIQTNGAGTISNCSFNRNGTVVCSCCE